MRTFMHIMRKENRNSEGECYQVSTGIEAIYNDLTKKLESLKLKGEPVDDYGDDSTRPRLYVGQVTVNEEGFPHRIP